MINYFLLLFILILASFVTFFLYKKDILSPSFISCVAFCLSILCAIIGLLSWNTFGDLSLKTVFIFIIGIFSFSFGEFIARKIKIDKIKLFDKINKKYTFRSNPSSIFLIVGFIIVFITTILMLFEIKRICGFYGFYSNSFSELLSFYRGKTNLFSSNMISFNFFVKQLKKISDVINLIFSYILINEFVSKEKIINKRKIFLLIITIIIGLFQTFLNSGGRSILMHYLVSYIFLFFFIGIKNKMIKFNLKFCIIIFVVPIVILVLFYSLLPLVGRKTSYNFIPYTSFYLGCSVPSFNDFNANYHHNFGSSIPLGEETFTGVYFNLNKYKIINYNRPLSLEWKSFIPGLASNVYTSLRAYYHDFGYFGVALLQFVFGFICSILYLWIKKSNSSIFTIIYAYYFYVLIDQIRVEQFYSLINTSNIVMIILFVVLYRVILCQKKKVVEKNE